MRKFVTALFFAIILSQGTSVQAENFSADWPKSNPDGDLIPESRCYSGPVNFKHTLNFWANYCLIPTLKRPVEFFVHSDVKPLSIPNLSVEFSNNVDKITRFYIVQSLWEASLVQDRAGSFEGTCVLPSASPVNGRRTNPKNKSLVLIHVIPRSIEEKFPCVFGIDELVSAKNFRAFALSKVKLSEIQDFRESWLRFALNKSRKEVSRSDVLAYADMLVNRFKWLQK